MTMSLFVFLCSMTLCLQFFVFFALRFAFCVRVFCSIRSYERFLASIPRLHGEILKSKVLVEHAVGVVEIWP